MPRMGLTDTIERLLGGLARFQSSSRGAVMLGLLSIMIAAGSLPFVMQLGLNSSFTALLPNDAPSVRDLKKIGDRLNGLTTLTVALECEDCSDYATIKAFARDIVPFLQQLEHAGVQSVDANVGPFEKFTASHRHLYAKLEQLEELRDRLQGLLEQELAKVNPLFVSLDDQPDGDASRQALQDILSDVETEQSQASAKLNSFEDGYFVHPDEHFLAIFLRTNIRDGDNNATKKLISAVSERAEALRAKDYPNVRVNFGGSLVMAVEEQDAIVQELAIATMLTILLVFLAIWIFFRKLRVIPLLGIGMLAPVMLTFACAELWVDYLNTSTAFLGSIVIGNGINPNIIWLARYAEERRGGASVPEALKSSHHGTWLATFTASTAAAVAYGSLIITDFRGFRDFGIIGGIGMELCWIGSLLFLPAWVAFSERIIPFENNTQKVSSPIYGRLFFSIASRFPRGLVVTSVVTGCLCVGLVTVAILRDPMEYDFRKLKSVRERSTVARMVNRKVGDIVKGMEEGNAIAMLVEKAEDTLPLKRRFEEYRNDHDVVYGKVRTIDDYLPDHQDYKIEVLQDIRDTLERLHPLVSEEDQRRIDEHMPPEEIKVLDTYDLPEEIGRAYTEKDGSRGRILFVEKEASHNIWDGRFLVAWANQVRHFSTESGEKPALAGRAPIFADMMRAVWKSTPRSIMASFAATLLLLFLAFRRTLDRTMTVLCLLLGIAWMGGVLVLLGERMNFLNVLAFPITFGNGVDYGVNVMRRYSQEASKGVREATRVAITESGGAVVLCSLTTIIAYSSLYTSANQALNSFGLAMAISEVTCVFAALLTLPAAMLYAQKRREARATRAR